MPVESAIKGSDEWFIGVDKTLRYYAYQSDGTTPQNMTGWALTWELYDKPGGTVQLSKTTGDDVTIGDGNGTGDLASVAVADDDTEGMQAGTYYHVLRRTDAGSEDVLSYGPAALKDLGVS